jgi:Natural resistance-associated macrophage protein
MNRRPWPRSAHPAPRAASRHSSVTHDLDVVGPKDVVLDRQSVDIEGALGRIHVTEDAESARRGPKDRLLTFLAVMGPGLIVMIGDNDAGGVATYAQAGQNYGYSLLWSMTMLIPPLIFHPGDGGAAGRGHPRRTRRVNHSTIRPLLGLVSSGDPFILNFLTLVTEFIGVALALEYLHIHRTVSVPIAPRP